jgi:hypothetical protein
MANISDSAGIFTGPTLDLFNAMETLVARDGDVAYAQLILQDAMKKVATTTQPAHAVRTGSTSTRRNP